MSHQQRRIAAKLVVDAASSTLSISASSTAFRAQTRQEAALSRHRRLLCGKALIEPRIMLKDVVLVRGVHVALLAKAEFFFLLDEFLVRVPRALVLVRSAAACAAADDASGRCESALDVSAARQWPRAARERAGVVEHERESSRCRTGADSPSLWPCRCCRAERQRRQRQCSRRWRWRTCRTTAARRSSAASATATTTAATHATTT